MPEIHSQALTKDKIDSILKSTEGADETSRFASYTYIDSKLGRERKNSQELYQYALSKDSSEMAKMAYYNKYSKRFSWKGETDKAIKMRKEGLRIAEARNNEQYVIMYHCNIGNAYNYLNKPDSSLYHLNKAQLLAEKEGNRYALWNVHYNKGLLQNTLGNIAGQKDSYLEMWEAIRDSENTPTKRFVLYNLVDFFSQLDEPVHLAKFTEILSVHYEDANPDMPSGHMPIKDLFENRASPENIPKLKNAIRVSDSINRMSSFAYATIALAKTYTDMGQPELGIPYLERATDTISRIQKPQVLMDLYKTTIITQEAAKNYKEAFEAKVTESNLRDSINTERMQRNIAELEVKFDTAKKEEQIAQQNLVIEKESRQKNQILLGLVALGLFSVLVFFFLRKRLKDQRTISAQKDAIQQQEIVELKQKNKLLALNSMIEGQEAERLRIAKDLHDSLGGLLSTVKAHFTTIQREIEQLEQLNITGKTNDLIDEACLEVRRISHNMMPHALSISGLSGAVEDLAENLKEEGYEVTLEMSQVPSEIDNTRKVMLYRLLQEIISNIRKHAEAKTILIQLLGHKNEIHLIVEDDGKGFQLNVAEENGGLGLKSINSRVEFLDGKIHWDTQPGQGTTISINIPMTT
ncbi:MAG: sensor histidine kinase [Flavobacteriaceae bacterium]|nr:sensor histidine kinase [Flavobacteriaceae bacterium]